MKPIPSCCLCVFLLCSTVLADDSPPMVLADAARQSPDDPEWAAQFMEQSRKASVEATARCAKESKVPLGTVWQNSALQLVVTYKCLSREDPKYQAAQRGAPTITAVAFEQAEKTCAAQGKKAKEFGLKMLTFYACASTSDAAKKPAENAKPQ
jgi:hypothetical protein